MTWTGIEPANRADSRYNDQIDLQKAIMLMGHLTP